MSLVVLVAVILAADRVTKELVLARPAIGHRRRIVRPVFTERPLLTYRTSLRVEVALWFAAVACAFSAVLVAPAIQHNPCATAGVVAALSGSLGNLTDRMLHGAVVDFIAVGRWPAFNLADMAIIAGAAVAGVSLI